MTTFDRLKKVFEAVFDGDVDVNTVKESDDLREDVGINSIGMLYMAMAIEEEFGVKFTNDDFPSLKTVTDVIACIEAKCE